MVTVHVLFEIAVVKGRRSGMIPHSLSRSKIRTYLEIMINADALDLELSPLVVLNLMGLIRC